MKRIGTLIITTILLSACTMPSITDMGNSILETVGLVEGTTEHDPETALANINKNLTIENEYYLGRAVAAKILSKTPPTKKLELNTYVEKLGQTLYTLGNVSETFAGYHFQVLDSPDVHAVSAPGGYVFVTSGLLQSMPDEDSLAAVLAHEIAHIDLRHGIKSIDQANINKTVASLGKLASGLNCAQVINQAGRLFGATVDEMVLNLFEKGYSREQEYEADARAIEILKTAGFDPAAVTESLKLLELNSEASGGWLQAHPATQKRIAKTKLNSTNSDTRKLRTQRFINLVNSL